MIEITPELIENVGLLGALLLSTLGILAMIVAMANRTMRASSQLQSAYIRITEEQSKRLDEQRELLTRLQHALDAERNTNAKLRNAIMKLSKRMREMEAVVNDERQRVDKLLRQREYWMRATYHYAPDNKKNEIAQKIKKMKGK